MANIKPKFAEKYKRLLPPVPQHIEQPSPCCHMYHSVGGCADEQAKPQDKEEPDHEEEAL